MKKLISLFCIVLILGATLQLKAQSNVGIGTQNPDPTAILQLVSSNQGLLVPSMDSASRLAIAGPHDGLLVYDQSYDCFYYYSLTAANWVSLCSSGGGGGTVVGGYNTAVSFNPATDSLSVTDGGGTISAYINPPGRWSQQGTTDITYNSSAASPFAQMVGTSVTFTPTKSVVFISATAAGDVDPTIAVACGVAVRIKDSGTGNVVIGASCVANSLVFNTTLSTYQGIAAWNVAMSTAYNVTPGVPVTLYLEWQGAWADGSTNLVRCLANSDPEQLSHRSIIVWE